MARGRSIQTIERHLVRNLLDINRFIKDPNVWRVYVEPEARNATAHKQTHRKLILHQLSLPNELFPSGFSFKIVRTPTNSRKIFF